MRVKCLAIAIDTVKLIQICFKKIGPCSHFSKDHKIVEVSHSLLHQIGFTGWSIRRVAAAFNAPIGGLLYVMEEVASNLPPDYVWRAFMTAGVGTFILILVLAIKLTSRVFC